MFLPLFYGGMGYYPMFDSYYFLLVLPAVLFAMWAQYRVQSTYSRYSRLDSFGNISGADAARRILDSQGLFNVKVEKAPGGKLSDHYDPRTRVVRLSNEVYGGTSVAALGVAAHETGHAIQHAVNYSPLHLRNAIIPITQIGSMLALPLVILGLVINFTGLIYVGIAAFGLAALFQLITLPVEFNASRRAISVLSSMNILNSEELSGARRVLSAAALTYVAALAVSLAQLLRLVLLFGGRRRD